MLFLAFITIILQFTAPALAYLDTTSKSFQKPASISVKPYVYHESKYDKFVDKAATKVAPRVLTEVMGGGTATAVKILHKAVELHEQSSVQK